MDMQIAVCVSIFLSYVSSPHAGLTLDVPCSQAPYICGRPPVQPTMHRVVGGHPAAADTWPWTVMMLEQGDQVCGGAIISETMVVSAAHCFEGVSMNSHRWEILAGRTHLQRPVHGEQKVKVKQIIVHPHYDADNIINDIALVILERPLVFTAHTPAVLPVCVPQGGQGVTAGQQCMLAGWGDTEGTGNEDVLNEVLLPVIADNTCSRHDYYGSEFEPATTFCAGYGVGGKDACQGDSGSPLACKVNNQWYIQGISSWGYDCAEPKWPGIYTDVSKYATWLSTQMASHSNCGSHVVG